MAILTPNWYVKPPPGITINPLHPLASGLIGAYLMNEGGGTTVFNIAPGNIFKNAAMSNTHTGWTTTPPGVGTKFDGNSTQGLIASAASSSAAALSAFAFVRLDSLANAYNSIATADNGSLFDYALLVKSTGKLAPYVQNGSGVTISADGTGTAVVATGAWNQIGLTYNSTVGLTSYINGKVDATTAANGAITSTAYQLNIGNSLFANRSLTGAISWHFIWNRVLSKDEVALLNTNPFAMFNPLRRRIRAQQPTATNGSAALRRTPWSVKPPAGTPLNLAHPLASQLAAFWPMNDSGTFVSGAVGLRDISGNNNHASGNTNTNADTTWTPAKNGIGLTHAKTNSTDGFTIPSLAFGATYSLETLINVRACATNQYLNIITNGNTLGFWLNGAGTNTFKIDFYSSGDHKGNTTMNAGTWYHLVITTNGSNLMSYYVNGVPDGTFAISTIFTAGGLLCDAPGGTEQFDGQIEYIRVWKNRILQPSEIMQLYTRPYDMFMPIQRRVRSGTSGAAPTVANSNFLAFM